MVDCKISYNRNHGEGVTEERMDGGMEEWRDGGMEGRRQVEAQQMSFTVPDHDEGGSEEDEEALSRVERSLKGETPRVQGVVRV